MIRPHVAEPGSVLAGWSPDALPVAMVVVGGVLYAAGARRLRGPALRTRRVVAFFGGLGALAAAVASPLHLLADTLFSWHMTQHLLLVLVAAPLLVYGRPVLVVSLGLPRTLRLRVRRFEDAPAVRKAERVLGNPSAAGVLYAAALWAWHLPGPYQAALHDDFVHGLEHASFLGAALLLWAVVIGAGHRRRVPYAAAAGLVFVTMLHSVWLAMILSFVPTAVYPLYASGAAAWGLTPLADQQIAGSVMWVPSGLVFIVTLAVLFLRWFKELDARLPGAMEHAGAEP